MTSTRTSSANRSRVSSVRLTCSIAVLCLILSKSDEASAQCNPSIRALNSPVNVRVGSQFEMFIGLGSGGITGGDRMQINPVELVLGQAMAFPCDRRVTTVPGTCLVEVSGDGIGNDDGLCDFLEGCESVEWLVGCPAGGGQPNDLIILTPSHPLYFVANQPVTDCQFLFPVDVVSPTPPELTSDSGQVTYSGECNLVPPLTAGAFATVPINLANLEIEKTCSANSPDGTHPVSITVTNTGGVLLTACQTNDVVFPDDPICPPTGASGDEFLFGEFNLLPGESKTIVTSVGPFSQPVCNMATITCDLSDSTVAIDAPAFDECFPLQHLRLVKKNQSDYPMPGIAFVVTGPVDRSCTTDVNGECYFPDIPVGQYTIDEPSPPTGYVLENCTPDEDLITPGSQATLRAGEELIMTCTNCKLPDLCIHKTDTQGTPMAGVRFVFTGPETRECTTNLSGDCCIEDAILNETYTITEPDLPPGYVFEGCDVDEDLVVPGTQVTLRSNDCGNARTLQCFNRGVCRDDTDCNDEDECTVDLCDPNTGCSNIPECASHADCADGDACTESVCLFNGCCKTKPLWCDDGNVCTTDSCDPAIGCIYEDRGGLCDDGNDCTIDSCDIENGCVHVAACSAHRDCDDGDACTDNFCLVDGCCTQKPRVCDDNDPCTGDSCDPAIGCVHEDIGTGNPDCVGNPCDSDGHGDSGPDSDSDSDVNCDSDSDLSTGEGARGVGRETRRPESVGKRHNRENGGPTPVPKRKPRT